MLESINSVKSPEGRVAKTQRRRALDITKHTDFEQGDMCFTCWKHHLNLEVELRFRFQIGWVAKCRSLELEKVFANQSPEDLSQELDTWLETELNLKPAPKVKSIWDIMNEIIFDEITLWPRQRVTIWESQDGCQKVDLYNDGYNGLRLIAINGRVIISRPIATNAPSAPAGEWKLKPNARQVYESWAKSAK